MTATVLYIDRQKYYSIDIIDGIYLICKSIRHEV